jgi:hypothetical protein
MRLAAFALPILCAPLALANVLEIPLDTLEPEGYFTVLDGMSCSVQTEGDRTYISTDGISEGPGGAYFYAPIINFEVYSGGTIDASVTGATLDFDARYFQEGSGENGEQPYEDEYTAFDVCLYDAGGAEWVWVDAFLNPEPYGEWHRLSLDLADTAGNPSFDRSQVSRMELHGYNPRWCWQDSIDLDTLVITPEPSTASLLALGMLGLLRRRR